MRATTARILRRFRTRRMLLRAGVVLGGVAVLLAVMAVAASMAYDQFGYHPDRNAREWASLAPRYETSESCRACHPAILDTLASAAHSTLACTSCHGPNPHGLIGSVPLRASVSTGALCLKCHESVTGRPASFPQVDPARHYATGACLVCHTPHTPAGVAPPKISHPLVNLPECIACHRDGGLKPLPKSHVPASDASCRVCHQPGSATD